jgi:hypothetical protein
MTVIPPTWEVETGRLWFKVRPEKSMRGYLKNKLKSKGLGVGLKWWFTLEVQGLDFNPYYSK